MPNKEYHEAVKLVEQAWAECGAREFCLKCIADPRRGGCCHGCETLGPTGCLDKTLPCTLWACSQIKTEFPGLSQVLGEIITKTKVHPYTYFRRHSPDLSPEQLVQIRRSLDV